MDAFEAIYQDGAFHPLKRYHNVIAAEFGDGELVTLERREIRSLKSHGHYFACVNSAWENLPDDMADRWPTADHLRRWALIRAGYHDERVIVCSSKAEALRLAAFIRPMDTYAVVIVRDAVATAYTAKSQSYKAMGRKVFAESKTAVLGILAGLIGVLPQDLTSNQRTDRRESIGAGTR